MKRWLVRSAAVVALSGAVSAVVLAQAKDAKPAAPSPAAGDGKAVAPGEVFVPRRQTALPGPALSPADAIAKMELPPGFKIEAVAAEPLVVNPTSFTWDDRGRIWVTESLEYPRRSPGKGQDRVTILEDTNADGVYDKQTVFKDGLNIPCGVVHGNGGVYVTNAPDILFLKDTDGDDKADTEEVILTGFGRDDTHELPNSLTWGPDGWLYGMNGVFNPSKVKDPATGKVISFTCAIWRYHPPTRRFELFAEGTSNPWGLDYNRAGDWFISCCVIDHLFHMTQSGYYHRQGGPYPPNVQQARLQSIATTKHQAAAYAGLCIYDADAYPEEYRGRLIMGNLHGSALNMDVLTRNGSTYRQGTVKSKGKDDPNPLSDGMGSLDFLQANDVWFMPVAQKVGPDGCVYVMDWYDRYHCYQDANRDPKGLDRLHGRIYRISYNGTPRSKPFDLQKLNEFELIERLSSPNVWWRRQAQRVLNEKLSIAGSKHRFDLSKMALDSKQPNNANMHALWLLVGQNTVDGQYLLQVLSHEDESTRAWGVRAVGNAGKALSATYEKLKSMATTDPSTAVRAQIAVAAGRLTDADPLPLLLALLSDATNGKDPLIPHLIFMNLLPLADKRGQQILDGIAAIPAAQQGFGESTVKWIKQAINTSGRKPDAVAADALKNLKETTDAKKSGQVLAGLVDALAYLPIDERANSARDELRGRVVKLIDSDDPAARVPAVAVGLWWRDGKAIAAARQIIADPKSAVEARANLIKALAESKVDGNIAPFAALAGDAAAPIRLRQVALDGLGAVGRSDAAGEVLKLYPSLAAELKPVAVNALIRTPAGASALLRELESKRIPTTDVTGNQARSIVALNDKALTDHLSKAWGTIRTDRDPERVKIVEKMRKVVEAGPGNAAAGVKIFEARCAVCHTIYGKGGTLGPDITGVGRDDLTAILTNVIDPNLVVGAAYQVHVARTKDGDVYSGLLVEDSDQRVVLRDQTQQMVVPKQNLAKLSVQNVSFMPEGLEAQLTDQEFRDLVAYLLTKEPPK